MAQTRVRILSETMAWIKDPDGLQICWVTGMAGSGKTSIAKTVCEQANADAKIMLGGSFFCSRSTGVAAQRDIRCVIPTLAQLLAFDSADFRLALAETIRDGIQHKEVAAQVDHLLGTPLSAIKKAGTYILFVIDALDECGGETTDGVLDDTKCHAVVTDMLEALVRLTQSEPKLPIKFLVTSRPEAQIRDAPVANEKLSQILRLHAVDATEVNADIRRYITTTLDIKLSERPKLRASITDSEVEDLVQLCDGLFIVASTAIAHTFGVGTAAAVSKFKRLLNPARDGLHDRASAPLDRMYEIILNDAAREVEVEATELLVLQRLLASLLSARMSLSVTSLADLLDMESYDVTASLSRLHAVVHVPDDDDTPGLRPVHASFGDYLYSRAPNHIRIPQLLGHDALAHGCLRVMAKLLHFNVSLSRSSHDSNPPGHPDSIAPVLEYACMQWAYHVAALVDTSNLDATIGQIFRPRLLSWLEVMSLLGQVWRAAKMLFIAAGTVNAHAASDLARFFRDANSFVASSYEAIERSAPHIYISALPFADKDSLVYQELALRCTGLITVHTFGVNQHRGRTVMSLTGHQDTVNSVSYSSDGRLLASGSDDGSVRIWDTRTGEEALSPLLSDTGSVWTVDFAHNSRRVASGTESGVVCVWDVSPGQTSHRRLNGHSGRVNCVKFSPDSSRLASASFDRTLSLWSSDTGQKLATLLGHTDRVIRIAFFQDGEILASGSYDNTIRLWHSSSGQAVREPLTNHSGAGIDLSPDGEMIAGIAANGVVLRKWKTGEQVALLKQKTTRYIQFSPDGRSLVAAGGQTVRLWNLQPDLQNASWVDLGGHGGNVNWSTFSPDGLYIASASDDRTIRIWNAGIGQSTVPPSAHDSAVCSVAVSHDGAFIVSGSSDKLVRVWNARTGEPMLPPLGWHTESVSSVSISLGGCSIASASGQTQAQVRMHVQAEAQVLAARAAEAQAQAALMEMRRAQWSEGWATEKVRAQVQAAQVAVMQAQAQVEARARARGQADRTIRLWNVQSGAVIGEPMRGHTSYVMAVAFSNNGRLLASASDDETVRIWDVATQQASSVGPLRCQSGANAVAFSPDDDLVAAGDISGRIYLWRTASGEQAHQPLHVSDTTVWSLAFSPDGAQIVVGGEGYAARIWDINAGQCVLVLQGHTKHILSVAWSLNDRVIAAGSEDATVRLWDAITGALLATLHGHTKAVQSVAFTRDGQFIISGSKDTTIRKWDVRAACRPASELGDDPTAALSSATLKDGWLVGSSGELILWVPVEYREYLQAALCKLLVGGSRVVIGVGDSGLHAGLNWTSCWRG